MRIYMFGFKFPLRRLCFAFGAITFLAFNVVRGATSDITTLLDRYNVVWDVPGPTSAQSMPIGNGDIGLNVWVETNGDLDFYIGKTDAWNEDVRSDQGLMKVGAVRVSLRPDPLAAKETFLQMLRLESGEIRIQEGTAELRVWV